MGKAPARLSWAELVESVGTLDVASFQATTGICERDFYRYRREGIPAHRADEIAVAYGLNPAAVWADWFDIELPPEAGVRECVECGEQFRARQANQRFCKRRCKDRFHDRASKRRKRSDPAWLEHTARLRRERYAENRRAELALSRVYYQRHADAKRAYQVAYRKANRERLNAQKREQYRLEREPAA